MLPSLAIVARQARPFVLLSGMGAACVGVVTDGTGFCRAGTIGAVADRAGSSGAAGLRTGQNLDCAIQGAAGGIVGALVHCSASVLMPSPALRRCNS